jgi:Protein of unknown function (DUF2934)
MVSNGAEGGNMKRDSRATTKAVALDQPAESRMNRIARRAHELYEARGGEEGKALDDWLEAERQIDAEMARESGH